MTQPFNPANAASRSESARHSAPFPSGFARGLEQRGAANSLRDHHVIGTPPDWSRPSQAFRRFDGTLADWRTDHPGHRELARLHRTGIRARLRRGVRAMQTGVAVAFAGLKACAQHARAWLQFEDILLGPSGRRRDIAVFAVGMAWGVMCAIGMMAAWGIHP